MDSFSADLVTDADISNLIVDSPDRRYASIKRAIAKGELLHLRRGLYYLGKRYQRGPVNLFVLAQKIYGPSYISFESALAHHGWIPEAVRTVTSATSKRARTFETSLGYFNYARASSYPFLTGVFREGEGQNFYWMAGPWKALADYVYAIKKDWKGITPLIKSLRIEEDDLKDTKGETLLELQEAYRSRRVKRFLKGVRRDLKL